MRDNMATENPKSNFKTIRLFFGALLIAALGLGGYFVVNYQVERQYENGKFSYFKISPRGSRPESRRARNNLKRTCCPTYPADISHGHI